MEKLILTNETYHKPTLRIVDLTWDDVIKTSSICPTGDQCPEGDDELMMTPKDPLSNTDAFEIIN